jgi:uncharacterized integral membrane protein
MRVVYWVTIFAASAFLISFAVSNRASVALGLWPLPFLIDLPLYLLALLLLLAGFVAGAGAAWISGGRARRELRRRRRRVETLERELQAARLQLEAQPAKGQLEAPA